MPFIYTYFERKMREKQKGMRLGQVGELLMMSSLQHYSSFHPNGGHTDVVVVFQKLD